MALSAEFLIGLATTLVGAAIILVLERSLRWLWRRPVRRFWSGFNKEVVIMTTEYKVASPEDLRPDIASSAEGSILLKESIGNDQLIVAKATSGYVMSYAMSDSLAKLRTYFEKSLGVKVDTIGDKGHSRPREGRSLVVLGSPIANRYLQGNTEDFAREYPLLNHFGWEVSNNGVELTLPDGEKLVPKVDDWENGIDFALIACFTLDPATNQQMVMVAGCNMWGTDAATRFLLDPTRLRSLPKRKRGRSGFAFVLRTRVSDGVPERIDLHRRSDGSVMYYL
jgi:hypothetical protein